ncbi:MAG TPA: hypothetical protein VHB97_02790 [Polyangia bacterium]|nr:hypothetical protein [Polyangia bacterium]
MHSRQRNLPRRSRQRGVLLGIVLILLAVLFAAGIFALWSMRGDTGSAGRDRLSRQLFDCAEQGLAYGKQYVSQTMGTTGVTKYLAANVCNTPISSSPNIGALPCWSSGGPFPTGGTAVSGYPDKSPFTQSITMDSRSTSADFQFTFAVYNDPGDYGGYYSDTNQKVIVYSRCTDLNTLQQRSVQALIGIVSSTSTDYTGQAGRGFRNQGNQNF